MTKAKKYFVWFKEIDKNDIPLVGGKGANLGEMTRMGIPVPNGFIITANAYFYFLKRNHLKEKIREILENINYENIEELQSASVKIKALINNAPVPSVLVRKITSYYFRLGGILGLKNALVAVRSSATAEDLPDASFAGQQETFLNVRGESLLIEKVRNCWASLFTPRAIFYRKNKNFDHFKLGIAVVIQKMIQSEISGVMFTADPVTNDKNKIVIEAIWGLGELIVQGTVTPDRYQIDRLLNKIIEVETNPQEIQLIKVGALNRKSPVPKNKKGLQKLDSRQIIDLANIGDTIHKHYFFPQDIEWAIEKGKIYIIQTRPITTFRKNQKETGEKIELETILEGTPASPGIAAGRAVLIKNPKEIKRVKKGDILVTQMTNPDYVPAMRLTNGIVTDKGGQTSHAAIVSRELGIPCVVGTKKATKTIKEGEIVTVDGTSGKIYKGKKTNKKAKALISMPNLSNLKTATKVYVNLGDPELANKIAKENVDGVGLLRAEFMIANIGSHPQKVIAEKKQRFFTEKLVEGMTKFCKSFYPRPVVYRATDFKTNEYRGLNGGEKYEPEEENPLLGFRGANRYIALPEVFKLEIEAIKIIRNKHGYKNLWLMIPFVRTPDELLEIKRILAAYGLMRNPSFKLWMMVEIPSNIILLKKFIETGIDGVSIGSNDLTMLILGIDRDNSEMAKKFNERDPAVLWAIRKTIKICKEYNITSSICGQAPSNYPSLVKKLVKWGITSLSVNPDAIEKTRRVIARVEKEVVSEKGKRQ